MHNVYGDGPGALREEVCERGCSVLRGLEVRWRQEMRRALENLERRERRRRKAA